MVIKIGEDTPATFVPAGHYFSPIVDPSTVVQYYERERRTKPNEIPGIEIDQGAFRELWLSLLNLPEPIFHDEKTNNFRFFVNNGNYCFSDAVILRGLIGTRRPKRIIEIGSGNSTACMLDCLDEFGLYDSRITCVEPYPNRLQTLLQRNDFDRVSLIKKPVQEVSLTLFKSLEANDILFIDSTHVVKTGSDVHYEFFHILPHLKEGVLIHFHDCPFPFEYPAKWVLHENRSWNEVYMLRAFLMYNSTFRIIFWTTLFVETCRELLEGTLPRMLDNPRGSGIWIRKERMDPVASARQ